MSRFRDRRFHRGLETTWDGVEYRLFYEGEVGVWEANRRNLA
ncbi:hypothetical protein A2U01_0067740, partial [Trifolium medium]|nr:hypothetical protein [Trifolium medium]